MYRRRFVRAAGIAGAAGLSGCSGGSDGGSTRSPTASPTATPTSPPAATPSPTGTPAAAPERRDPRIDLVNAVAHWNEFGDVADTAVGSVGDGAVAKVGTRYSAYGEDGNTTTTLQVEVYDGTDDLVDRYVEEDDIGTDEDGYQQFEWVVPFDASDWDRGEYRAEVLVRDEAVDTVSRTATTAFDVVEPLSASEVEAVRFEGPESVASGETFGYRVWMENRSDRDSSVVSPISARREGGEWRELTGTTGTANLPAGGEGYYGVDGASLEDPGEYQYRLDTVDVAWTLVVEEP